MTDLTAAAAELLIALVLAVSPAGGSCAHWSDDLASMAYEQRLAYPDTGHEYLNPFRACALAEAALTAAGRDPAGGRIDWDGKMSNLRVVLSYALGESQLWRTQRDGDGSGRGWTPGWNVARGLFSIGTQWCMSDRSDPPPDDWPTCAERGHMVADEQADSAAWSMLWGAVNLDCLGADPQRRCAGGVTGYGLGLRSYWPRLEFLRVD